MLVTEKSVTTKIESLIDQAEKLRQDYQASKESIQNDETRTYDSKNELVGALRIESNEKIRALRQELQQYQEKSIEHLNERLFGFTAHVSSDKIVEYRDAVDRVQAIKIKDRATAKEMYDRAVLSKDSTLQRALLERALTAGWGEIIDEHGRRNPSATNDLKLMRFLTNLEENIQVQWNFVEILN